MGGEGNGRWALSLAQWGGRGGGGEGQGGASVKVLELYGQGGEGGGNIDGSSHKYYFCRGKTLLLSRQKYTCRDKHVFVATSTCLSR